jgi:hypothetical protein
MFPDRRILSRFEGMIAKPVASFAIVNIAMDVIVESPGAARLADEMADFIRLATAGPLPDREPTRVSSCMAPSKFLVRYEYLQLRAFRYPIPLAFVLTPRME